MPRPPGGRSINATPTGSATNTPTGPETDTPTGPATDTTTGPQSAASTGPETNRDRSLYKARALEGHYREYCRQQVSLLLEIIPREAVRPLYRRARIWATKQGIHESKDPMATLRAYCLDVLPLPPFDVWLSDHKDQRVAQAGSELGWSPLAEPMEPVALEVRRVELETEPWYGTLEAYRGADAWRGLIRFQRDGEERQFRTAEIFCEDNLQDLRNRFISFTAPTLSAFLRSTLP